MNCGFRFTTYERREEMPLIVIKRDGSRETFDRQKLMRGLVAATVKRDIPLSSLESLIDGIVSDLRDGGITEVRSKDLGEMVLHRLLVIDKVAYVRFASVYRDFKDVDEFHEELRRLAND
jgi:transcriptional repressor NrdR